MTKQLLGSLPVTIIVGVLLACGGAAPAPATVDGAELVRLGKADPPPGAVELGPVKAEHGGGCGLYGKEGNFDGAYALLRGEGKKLGADYVQIMTVREPYSDGKCAHNEYALTGVAYKMPAGDRSETSQQSSPVGDAKMACVPGATQVCKGPGACDGAQSCQPDGRSFGACDCGPSAP